MRLLEVLNPGFSTTIQDHGRVGFQKYGVPASGAMDPYSFLTANLLVGNSANEACLEATVLGPKLRFLSETQIAITGADLSPTINHNDVRPWRTLQVHKNDLLSFGHSRSGCRAYLAVKGGLNTPVVMGSRSTCLRGGFGGHHGRPLKAGDVLEVGAYSGKPRPILELPEPIVPKYTSKHVADVILGPQDDYFTEESISKLLTSSFIISMDSDRMGYRLEGETIQYRNSRRMISDAIPIGAVQVPEGGKPILMMRDAQTTGGYPKIAVVSTPSIAKLGQAKPNDEIMFQQVSPIRAQKSIREYLKFISGIKHTLRTVSF
jgi:antagonist of KipI